MTTPDAAPSGGFVGALCALGDGLLAGAQERLALVSIELQEEKFRVLRILAWISAAMLMGALTLAFAGLAIVVYFWESARLAALVGVTVFDACATAALVIGLRRFLARQPRPFAASLDELGQDRTCLRQEL